MERGTWNRKTNDSTTCQHTMSARQRRQLACAPLGFDRAPETGQAPKTPQPTQRMSPTQFPGLWQEVHISKLHLLWRTHCTIPQPRWIDEKCIKWQPYHFRYDKQWQTFARAVAVFSSVNKFAVSETNWLRPIMLSILHMRGNSRHKFLFLKTASQAETEFSITLMMDCHVFDKYSNAEIINLKITSILNYRQILRDT